MYGSGNADSVLGISSVPHFRLQRFFHLQVIKERPFFENVKNHRTLISMWVQ
jgi:hypothetical protein